MKNKIINSLLILTSCLAFYFIITDYFKMVQYKKLKNDYGTKYIKLQLELSKNINSYIDSYVVDARNLNEPYSFLLLNKINKRDRHNIETARILYSLDSIISDDLLGENWVKNKSEIRSIFLKATNADDSLKLQSKIYYGIPYDLDEIFKKDKLTFFEWSSLLDISIYYKNLLQQRMVGFCMCFSQYGVLGIPSKQVVRVGDTVSVDLVNFIAQDFIPQTYSFHSNYDNFLSFESGYNGCRYCGAKSNAFLLQEYQIPFSEIENNKKWRSVFYFRNDKLEQDSVVLERELEF